MDNLKAADIIRVLNGQSHEVLAHRLFQKCFLEAVNSGKIRGLKKTSLFRSTPAYFLLVSGARERIVEEVKTLVSSQMDQE